ncbi:bactofilin family protein [Bacteroides caecimuris]|uniref:Polymer-forming cytoskeletal protein n=1 Tax=Bacteroides caecimuris TaxID=1796613 RepID=A0A4S2DGR7_9BACE|nr:polymer-forming cytoskeletal protein [Bacteroides caecimuris]TGY41268.1 polymer-forming cytoskeletal protein [Bacteroides caecimuris]
MFGTKKNKEADFITTAEPLKLTTIATGTVLKGIIEVEGSLRVDGVIEGDVTCHKMVVIGPQGTVTGNITSVSAVLQGTLKGDIHVTDLLTLKAGCLMNGDIYTCKLEIEPQARFNGTCNTIEEQQPQSKATE